MSLRSRSSYHLNQRDFSKRPKATNELLPRDTVQAIKLHLGGDEVLRFLGAHDVVVDNDRFSFVLERPNPKGVHTVVISVQRRGLFNMDCYGMRSPGSATAPFIDSARQILPENLATVLGKLTGIEEIHHCHF